VLLVSIGQRAALTLQSHPRMEGGKNALKMVGVSIGQRASADWHVSRADRPGGGAQRPLVQTVSWPAQNGRQSFVSRNSDSACGCCWLKMEGGNL
jgi:hypothetical protein